MRCPECGTEIGSKHYDGEDEDTYTCPECDAWLDFEDLIDDDEEEDSEEEADETTA